MSELKHQVRCPQCKTIVSKLVDGKKCYECTYPEPAKKVSKPMAGKPWGIDNSVPNDECEVLG